MFLGPTSEATPWLGPPTSTKLRPVTSALVPRHQFRPVPEIATVPAVIPLSLLEAIRNLDTPVEDGLEELAAEIVARRLGLSTTVAAQIERYRKQAEQGDGVPLDEALSVLRLVGRRPDAELAFADAGRRLARLAAPQGALQRAPAGLGRRLGSRAAARVVRRVMGGELRSHSEMPEVAVTDPLPVRALPGGEGCGFYGSAVAELLRRLTGFEGAIVHEQCRGRGDAVCLWRAAPAEEYQ